MDQMVAMHMASGDGDTSYARNSTIQGDEQARMRTMIEEAIAGLLDGANQFPDGMVIADLGCSCGPNALALVSSAVDAIRRRCMQIQQQPPEVCIQLNDLPGNDFNSVIKSLAIYRQTQEGSSTVLTGIVPGSFHGRLFSKCSLHLVCSSSSLHWFSKAPDVLVRNKIPFYNRNEAVRRAQHSTVIKAYAKKFDEDFTRFLALRAQEIVPGGRVVFSIVGRLSDENTDKTLQELKFTASVLHEMASMGLIGREELDSFYMPGYGPSEKELRKIIESEGSFSVDQMSIHEPTICVGRGSMTPLAMACAIRAVMEPMIVQHFGLSTGAMDQFVRIAERLVKARPLDEYPNVPWTSIAASLTRRT